MVIKHLQVKDVMKKQNELPLCKEGDMIMDQLTELTSKGCGCLLVVDDEYHLIGTFTNGDLRRTLKSSGTAILISQLERCATGSSTSTSYILLHLNGPFFFLFLFWAAIRHVLLLCVVISF
jgi:hypothetical protein